VPSLSAADHGATPPVVRVPRDYNAARDLIERNLAAGRVPKVDHIDGAGRYTYAELAERVNRAANALPCWGVSAKSRVMLALLDGIDFPSVSLWAITAGIVPVVANTLLTTGDCKFMLEESR
jgi:benzoate-CoA ligase